MQCAHRSLIASWLIGLCLGLALRHTSIELLKGLKDLPSLLSDGPVSHLPVDELLSEDIEVRLAPCDALHARRPLGPAGVKDGQVLFDDFKAGSAARLPGKDFQYGQLKAHMRTQRFIEIPTIPALATAWVAHISAFKRNPCRTRLTREQSTALYAAFGPATSCARAARIVLLVWAEPLAAHKTADRDTTLWSC